MWVEMKAWKTNKQGKKRLENVRREGKKERFKFLQSMKENENSKKKIKKKKWWDFTAQNTVH